MIKKLFVILCKTGISLGILFLGMYFLNIGLGFTNASNDFLVMLGYGVSVFTIIAIVMLNVILWKKEYSSHLNNLNKSKNKEKE